MIPGRSILAASRIALAPLFLDAAPVLAAPGRLGGGESLSISLGRIVAALVICIIVSVLAAVLIRQRAGRADLSVLFARLRPGSALVQVVETRRLSANADICVVRYDGREYLLLILAGAARLLRERPLDAPTAPGNEARCD